MMAVRCCLLGVVVLAGTTAAAAEPGPFFEQKVRPVLVKHCYSCHSAEAKKLRGGLRLDTREASRKGGDTGPAVVPGKPEASLLLKALRYEGDLQMPPDGKLPDAVVRDFETWIKTGAFDPRDGSARPTTATTVDVAAGKKFWAFQPPRAATIATIDGPSRIDALVRARLQAVGLQPAPEADRRTLLRRLSFDLIGLPPTPEEVEAFVNDTQPDSYERQVDRLLASPQYGARWARVWLDVARYAEDQAHIVGNDQSLTYPNAYLYRDWVIKAFNDDLPYDRFVTLQLAADLVEGPQSPNLAALGFLGLGPKYYDRGKLAVMADEWEDRVDVVGRGLLGLTVACARCHDHKYDPIRTEDYYGLAGVFASTRMYNRPLAGKMGDADAKQPKEAMHLVREGAPTDLTVFVRGDVTNKGPQVKRHFLSVLCDGTPPPFTQGSGRRELAEAVASRTNPLTARVLVNRIWAAFFGRGLVATPSNFGQLGERPSHPELLDDLAVRFMANGWSLKALHRDIVLSATYRQASAGTPSPSDPENRLLGRMARRRLSVEAWRDALLAVAGRLDAAVGGPSIDPLDPNATKRTVYSRVSRLELNRLLSLFDFPDPNVTADRRADTTTPLQKMFVLNSPFMTAQAEALARRLGRDVPGQGEEVERRRIDRAYRLLYARPATEAETRMGVTFLTHGGKAAERWPRYAHVLLAANEMMYLD